jgi:glycosyltransferase 2 family protein
VLRIAAIVCVVALLALFVRRLEWDKLGAALASAKLWPLLISSALYFVCLFAKALSWRLMLAPDHIVGTGRLFRYTIAAFAASAITPARAGELFRVWALKARDGVPASDTTAVALAEKLLDAVSLLIVVAPVPWLLPALPDWVANSMLIVAGVTLAIFIAIFIAVGRIREPRSWFAHFIHGMHAFREPRRLLTALGVLVLMWFADLLAVMLVLYAVGLSVPIAGGLFILFSFNLAIAVPSTPAQVGALQLGALVATRVLGIPDEPALAFALLYQAMQVIPLLAVGLVTARSVRRKPVADGVTSIA